MITQILLLLAVQSQRLQIDDILDMEHEERHVWLREIAKINQEINDARKRG